MARFPSIDEQGAFESPEVQDHIKELVTGSTEGITVDTSVGTRVFVGDTMIHGDTGLRRVDTVNGQGYGYIRRIGNQVSVYFRDVIAPTGEIYILPTGFRPDVVPQYGLVGRTGGRALATFTVAGGGSLTQGTSHDIALYFSFTFNTNNAWPASLPGTPV